MRHVLHVLNERGKRHHWSVRVVRWVALISSGAMAVAAATSGSDHHIRSDGTKGTPKDIEGDPGGKPTDDPGQKSDAGEKTDPESDTNELDESGAASR